LLSAPAVDVILLYTALEMHKN